jgi:pseudo-rSAM protein
MGKNYWFYIEPYVYISIKNRSALLYNSYSGKILEYKEKPAVLKLLRRLNLPVNLRIIPMKDSDMGNAEIHEFVNELRSNFMGDLLDKSYSKKKPLQTPPMMKIKKDVEYLKTDILRSEGEDILEYLSEVSIYIDNRCSQGCSHCSEGFKQFPCCTSKRTGNSRLDKSQIESFFNEVKGCKRLNLNILGGDIFSYPKFEELTAYFSSLKYPITYYLHYLNAALHIKELKLLGGNESSLNILVSFPIDVDKLKLVLDALGAFDLKIHTYFIIRDKIDLEKSKELLRTLSIPNPAYRVFYDGGNLGFFEENIFITRDDISFNKPSLKEIYSRTALNSNYFGTLTILSDYRIFADLNASCLGRIGKESIYIVLLKEMKTGSSWLKTRKAVIPCKYCNYEALCPSISTYNSAIGKYNLCHIWEG